MFGYKAIAVVALSTPFKKLFDYACSEIIPAVGVRVRVPFGKKELVGIVVDIKKNTEIPLYRLREITSLLDKEAILDKDVLRLCQFSARYYHYSFSHTVLQSIPAELRGGKKLENTDGVVWRICNDVKSTGLSVKQKDLYTCLQASPLGLGYQILLDIGFRESTINSLFKLGVIFPSKEKKKTSMLGNIVSPYKLSDEQSVAVEKICDTLEKFCPFLLEGVTSSGKTEVYMQVIARVLERQRQVLVLVPEINLTPQTVARFHERFRVPIALLHSRRKAQAYLQDWIAAKKGSALIVIGTRSAIYAPIARLGLIVVDEEHDSSYKQQSGLLYSARDLSLVRARHANVPVVLGSATPSLETLRHALSGYYNYLQLKNRTSLAQLPKISLLDIRNQSLKAGLSQELIALIRKHINIGCQVIVLLNRRGYAPTLFCQGCGWTAQCKNCDVRLTLHKNPTQLLCHYCNFTMPVPVLCPACSADDLIALGEGTERSESFIMKCFPHTKIIRMDQDNTRKKGAFSQLLKPVHEFEPCILIGTQMLAKGHHFPKVSLVAVINVDQGILSSDFRGLEKTAQLIIQVAGRAGRAKELGEVVIQTTRPDDSMLRTLICDGYNAFARALLEERKKCDLPPYRYLTVVKAESKKTHQAEKMLRGLSVYSRGWLQEKKYASITIVGPISPLVEKRQNNYRSQLLFLTKKRQELGFLLDAIVEKLKSDKNSRVRCYIDVDAHELL